MQGILDIRFNNKDIISKRKEITDSFCRLSSNVNSGVLRSISTSDLELLFYLYDEVFLNKWFKENYKGTLKFSLSKRMTRSAGITLFPKNVSEIKPENLALEIRISVDFLLQYNLTEGSKRVCGTETISNLEALQLILEHEICHLIELIIFKESNCKKARFKRLAEKIFGHTESSHGLPTNIRIAKEKYGITIGDAVSFDFQGRRLTGVIYNINKRATVMVKDSEGIFTDNRGNRYTKYYVPISHLNV